MNLQYSALRGQTRKTRHSFAIGLRGLALPVVLIFGILCSPVALRAADAPADVPKGVVTKHTFDQSKIFPGTVRDYWVYVPAQYDPTKPACVWINQDGIQNNAPDVFDHLIAAKEMPVTVGVFVMHGRVPAPNKDALDRFNRSYEYDGMGSDYARFLLEELLPHIVADQKLNLSTSGNDRGIGGSSSGAVCAFTAAWERPKEFTRVFSSIGTYVGLRGGNIYPTLIRKYEPKPLRVFLQDGTHDQNIWAGDWWMANNEMERALTFAGYEVSHVWGEGGHDGKQANEIFPDAMRWLWKDWPTPVQAGRGSPQLQDILLPGEGWQLVGEGYKWTDGVAANAKGEVYFSDHVANLGYKLGADGKPNEFFSDAQGCAGQNFGPDGKLYVAAQGAGQIRAYAPDGKSTVLADGLRAYKLVVLRNGNLYATGPGWEGNAYGKVWLVNPRGEKKIVDSGIESPTGIAVSPDQSLLYVADFATQWIYSYQIQPDGTLSDKQKYFYLHISDLSDASGAGGMCCDRDGRLYVASFTGIQVCDQAGRVTCILPSPGKIFHNVCFGGEQFDTLYATCGTKVYKRKLKTTGALPFGEPLKPTPPRL